MYYRSTINYFLFVFRIIFILICFFFLLALLNIFPLLYEDRRTPLIGKLLLAITGGMGVCWGIIMTTRAIYFRTIIVTIQDKSIEIHQVFKRIKNHYHSTDIKKITAGTSYDNGNWSKGVNIEFKNHDKYEFIWYDYLNFREMKESIQHLRKVYEERYI
ncbi:MAG TPA: hypothetical protein VFZ33_18150 [Chitinophagaceae bacterium]